MSCLRLYGYLTYYRHITGWTCYRWLCVYLMRWRCVRQLGRFVGGFISRAAYSIRGEDASSSPLNPDARRAAPQSEVTNQPSCLSLTQGHLLRLRMRPQQLAAFRLCLPRVHHQFHEERLTALISALHILMQVGVKGKRPRNRVMVPSGRFPVTSSVDRQLHPYASMIFPF